MSDDTNPTRKRGTMASAGARRTADPLARASRWYGSCATHRKTALGIAPGVRSNPILSEGMFPTRIGTAS
jgi:hypothetical protein